MTFKHVKFEDSPIMRSLEKVAREKGLIKPEAIQKKAAVAKKADMSPSSNLMENIFKLCAGMRAKGLEKEASEVEVNYLNYKRAQTLYEAHKEKGEDLVHAAHPDGSHKLEGVDGEEATFEDILDQHAKMMQKIEKMPTGKLSSASQVMNAVKKALGQVTAPKESETELYAQLNDRLNKLLPALGATISILKTDGGPDYDTEMADEARKEIQSALATRPFDRTAYRAAMAGFTKLQETSKSGNFKTSEWFGSPDADDPGVQAWNKRSGGQMSTLGNVLQQVGKILTKIENIRVLKEQGTYQTEEQAQKSNVNTIPEVTVTSDPLTVKLHSLIGRLQSFKGVLSISRDPDAKKWIDDEVKEITSAIDRIDDISDQNPGQRKNMEARYQRDVATFEQEVNQFQKDWVDA